MAITKIEWCDFTFNPWRGCTKVSPGCANCYAEQMSKRNPKTLGIWGESGTRVVAGKDYWRQPLKWNAAAKAAGERHRVFCASLADVFEDWNGPITSASGKRLLKTKDGWTETDLRIGRDIVTMADVRSQLFWLIYETPNLDWLLLTKRPQNFGKLFNLNNGPPSNVWLGVSVEDQTRADERIPLLLQTPAAVRFLSCEPLLGPVVLHKYFAQCECGHGHGFTACPNTGGVAKTCDRSRCDQLRPLLSWVIVGGESGGHARPMHPAWAIGLRDQCVAASVPFFFKQHGEWAPGGAPAGTTMNWIHRNGLSYGTGETIRHVPGDQCPEAVSRVGKKAAGRLLDGKEWSQFPEVQLA